MKVLILKSYGIGNVVMLTPTIRALSEAGHEVYLLYDAGPLGGPTKEILEDWDAIKAMQGYNYLKDKNCDHIVRWVADVKPDVCVQSWPGDALWDWLTPFIQCSIRRAPKVKEITQHETEYNLDLVSDLIDREGASLLYSLPIYGNDFANVSSTLDVLRKGGKKIVAICPGYKKDGSWEKKHWGNEYYGHFINMLPDNYAPVIIDGADGIGNANAICHIAPKALNLAGQTSIKETMALLSGVDLVVGNDCGPMHIAAAYGKPMCVIFGETNPVKNRPINPKSFIITLGGGNNKTSLKFLIPPSLIEAMHKHVFPEVEK